MKAQLSLLRLRFCIRLGASTLRRLTPAEAIQAKGNWPKQSSTPDACRLQRRVDTPPSSCRGLRNRVRLEWHLLKAKYLILMSRQQQGHPRTRNPLQPPAAFPDSGCHTTGLRCRSWLNHDPNSFRPIPQAPSTACSAACDVRSCAASTITPVSRSSTANTGCRPGLRWSPPEPAPSDRTP